MGLRDDAAAAYAKTVEAQEAEAKEAADKLAVAQAEAEVEARKHVEQWASDLGYPGQAVITRVSFPSTEKVKNRLLTHITFTIDDLEFYGEHINKSLTVELKDGDDKDIRTLEALGKAIRRAEHRKRW